MSLSYPVTLPRLQVWAHYEEQPVEEVMPVLEEKERSASYKPVFVTEITDDLHFYVQDVETGECLCAAPLKIPYGTYSCYCPCLHRSGPMSPLEPTSEPWGGHVAGQAGPLRTGEL